MVLLKNVKRTNNIIECDYYPEGGESFGHVVIDVNKHDFVKSKCIMTKEDLHTRSYFNHALIKLMKISESEEFEKGEFQNGYPVWWY